MEELRPLLVRIGPEEAAEKIGGRPVMSACRTEPTMRFRSHISMLPTKPTNQGCSVQFDLASRKRPRGVSEPYESTSLTHTLLAFLVRPRVTEKISNGSE